MSSVIRRQVEGIPVAMAIAFIGIGIGPGQLHSSFLTPSFPPLHLLSLSLSPPSPWSSARITSVESACLQVVALFFPGTSHRPTGYSNILQPGAIGERDGLSFFSLFLISLCIFTFGGRGQ